MCEPISTTLGLMSAVSSFAGQKSAADAQEAAQQAASKAESARASSEKSSMRVQQLQENIAVSQRKESNQIQGMAAKARARLVALTEAGAGGRSLDTVLGDISAKSARYSFSEDRQRKLEEQNRVFQMRESDIRTNMNQLRINKPIKQANLIESGIQGIQTGLSMYNALPSSLTASTPPTP